MPNNPKPPLDDKEFTDWIAEFISSVDYSELITVDGGIPHIRPMIYVSEGVNIYMVTGNDSSKVQQVLNNPNVSVMIIKSLSEASDTQEIIVLGKAEITKSPQEREQVFKLFQKKPTTYQEWTGKESQYTILKIIPIELKYFDYSTGESQPRIIKF